ncbi:MAG: hypothetical protein COB67_05800 [SAR324 cluster bacterium]|uniref:Uncharacterized protein n=1 Tax=SAR324 cluster bacterium TaxID=2024889 RepID=A0A2A4T5X4_9DELT|nr:MAG: hypothetical protein COB67_05800 [SAR324 cluster bacterium]
MKPRVLFLPCFLILTLLSVCFPSSSQAQNLESWQSWSVATEVRAKIWLRVRCRQETDGEEAKWQFQMINNTISKMKMTLDFWDGDDYFARWTIFLSPGQARISGLYGTANFLCQAGRGIPEFEELEFTWKN